MKKRSALIFGLPAILLAFSLVLAGCDDPNNDSGSTPSGDPPPVLKVITGRNISTDWGAINTEVLAEGKNVILDLTGCTATGNTISGAFSSPTGNDMNIIENNQFIKGIILPSTLQTIGNYAFSGCSYLTAITIPAGVTSIGDYAFCGCSYLTGVTIPASVTTIGINAFESCIGLTAITVDGSNTDYSSQDGVLFNYNKTSLIKYPAKKSGSAYTIPASVTSIGESAFRSCSSLTAITIPASVTSIGNEAFYGCSSLTSVTIPANVTSIGNDAFYGCFSLTSISVNGSNSNYSSQDGVLFNYNKTSLIQYPRGKSDGAYTIPSSVATIGISAFLGCSSLTSVTIPSSVTTIGINAFVGCTSLTSVTFAGTISESNFSANAFYGDLRDTYLAGGGGAGTYTRAGSTWTKQ